MGTLDKYNNNCCKQALSSNAKISELKYVTESEYV